MSAPLLDAEKLHPDYLYMYLQINTELTLHIYEPTLSGNMHLHACSFYSILMYVILLCNVVEAHCYALQCRQIDCEQIRSRISRISGHEGLRQLRTKLKDTQFETCLYS